MNYLVQVKKVILDAYLVQEVVDDISRYEPIINV